MFDKQIKLIFEKELLDELNSLPKTHLPAQSVLLKSGSYIKVIPLLISGKIKVIKTSDTNKEILLYHIMPNESCILSITSSFNEQKSKINAITETDSEIIPVPVDRIKKWMNKYPSWRTFLMKLYNERLIELLSILDEVAFKNVDFRLIERLKEKINNRNTEIHTTHQQLADELGTAREVVSRLLKKLENEGKIEIRRGKIKIIGNL